MGEDAGTQRFNSAAAIDGTETRTLPTGEALSRPTAPTTVLDGRRPSGGTRGLRKPKSRKAILIVAAAITAAVAVPSYLHFSRKGSAIDSVAVLPFVNASADPDADYLSEGLAESLIYSLSQLPNLRVSPTSSVFRYKGKEIDPLQVGNELE